MSTTTTIKPAPVRRTLTVRAPQAKAFDVFTAGFGRWWPAGHSIGKSPQRRAVLEPGVAGRWYEIGEDGSEAEWGRVLVWEPPSRLVLAWQVNGQWQFDPGFVTEVEVRFTAEGPDATRVDFEHRNLEKFGEAAETLRAAFESPRGWGGLLERYAAACAEGASGPA